MNNGSQGKRSMLIVVGDVDPMVCKPLRQSLSSVHGIRTRVESVTTDDMRHVISRFVEMTGRSSEEFKAHSGSEYTSSLLAGIFKESTGVNPLHFNGRRHVFVMSPLVRQMCHDVLAFPEDGFGFSFLRYLRNMGEGVTNVWMNWRQSLEKVPTCC